MNGGLDWSFSGRDIVQIVVYLGTLGWGIFKYGRQSTLHESNTRAAMAQVLQLHADNSRRLDTLEKNHALLQSGQSHIGIDLRDLLDRQVDIVRQRIHDVAETSNRAALELAKVETRSTNTEQRLDRIDSSLGLLVEKTDRLLSRRGFSE